MAPSFLVDLTALDLDHVTHDYEAIEQANPHRGQMRLIDRIHWMADDYLSAVASRDVRDDEFWVPGHIPGRPLFPGVLMIEAAAQLASFMTITKWPKIKFLGFSAVNNVKFRGQVTPGDRLYMIGKAVNFRPRRFICATQAFVDGKLVYEGEVTGMPI